MSKLITLDAAANELGVHINTMRAWVKEGQLPSYRLGPKFVRVRMSEVLTALSKGDRADIEVEPTASKGGTDVRA